MLPRLSFRPRFLSTTTTTTTPNPRRAALAARGAELDSDHAEYVKKKLYGTPLEDRVRVPSFARAFQKIWFPNTAVTLVEPKYPDADAKELVVRVPPRMTKHEIKDYLQAVFGFNVKSVTTVIRMGKLKYPHAQFAYGREYRTNTYKQARVELWDAKRLQQPSNARPVAPIE